MQKPRDNWFSGVFSTTEQGNPVYVRQDLADPATGIYTLEMGVGMNELFVDTTTGVPVPKQPPVGAPARPLPDPDYPIAGAPCDIYLPPRMEATGQSYLIVAVCCSGANPVRVFDREEKIVRHTFNANLQHVWFFSWGYGWDRGNFVQLVP